MHQSIELQEVSVNYRDIVALSGVSLNVSAGQFVSIVGSNGSGKTTLLKVINGLIKPLQGKVRVLGKNIKADLNKRTSKRIELVSNTVFAIAKKKAS